MSRFDLTRKDLADLLSEEPHFRADQLWRGLYHDQLEPEAVTTLSKRLRASLSSSEALAPAFRMVSESASDRSATVKMLLEAPDKSLVETVVMRYRRRVTACISSQSGCAMACSFCATGQLGFGRQLTTGEIVEQVIRASALARREEWGRLTNLVLMGMGEPLANYQNVFSALRRVNEELVIGARSITVSTVGIVPGIIKMSNEPLQVNLAVSLHAANDELRSRLLPINRRYPLAALTAACTQYRERTHRRISFEWACIAGVNDRLSDAAELAALAGPLGAHVNLIPLNPTPGYKVLGTPAAGIRRFRDELTSLGVRVTLRDTRGSDVDAACGQLAAGMAAGQQLHSGRRRVALSGGRA